MRMKPWRLTLACAVMSGVALSGCSRDEPAPPPPPESVGPEAVGTQSPGYGVKPQAADPEAQASVDVLHLLGSAVEAYEDEHDEYPVVTDVEELERFLVPEYIPYIPALDGWQRRIQVEATPSYLELRSLGADGVADPGPPRGPVTDPNADIVYADEAFRQWPASAP